MTDKLWSTHVHDGQLEIRDEEDNVLVRCQADQVPDLIVSLDMLFNAHVGVGLVFAKPSSNIEGARYMAARAMLRVTFKSGKTYEYFGVEDTLVEAWQQADSPGKFFTEHIRNPEQYPYREATEASITQDLH